MGSSTKKKRKAKSLYMKNDNNMLQKYEDQILDENTAVIEAAFLTHKCDDIAELEINVTAGNIVIKCHKNLTEEWVNAIELLCSSKQDTIAPTPFWSVKTYKNKGKVHLHQAYIKYYGKKVNFNVYPETGTIMIQGANYVYWMQNNCDALFLLVKNQRESRVENHYSSTPKHCFPSPLLIDTNTLHQSPVTISSPNLINHQFLSPTINQDDTIREISFTGDIRDCSIQELTLLLSEQDHGSKEIASNKEADSSETALKEYILSVQNPNEEIADKPKTCNTTSNEGKEYRTAGTQTTDNLYKSLNPKISTKYKTAGTQTQDSNLINGFENRIFADTYTIDTTIPHSPWTAIEGSDFHDDNGLTTTHEASISQDQPRQNKQPKVLVIGCSNLKGPRARGLNIGTVNPCIVANGGDRIEDVRNRLQVLLDDKTNLVACTIHVGTNNILQYDTTENMVQQYINCIEIIRKNCKDCSISICSIPPHKTRSDINDTILEVNCQVEQLCQETACTFIDYTSSLVKNNYVIRSCYGKYTNIHLNQEGTNILCEHIESFLSSISLLKKKCHGCGSTSHLIRDCLDTSFYYKCNICKIVSTDRNHRCYI